MRNSFWISCLSSHAALQHCPALLRNSFLTLKCTNICSLKAVHTADRLLAAPSLLELLSMEHLAPLKGDVHLYVLSHVRSKTSEREEEEEEE